MSATTPTVENINVMLAEQFPGSANHCVELGDDYAVAAYDVRDDNIRPGGFVSGPTQFAIVDSALWFLTFVALGRIAHESVLRAAGQRLAAFPFAHGAQHRLPGGPRLYDSYHCSRYNTNTGVLTTEMFRTVFATVRQGLGQPS